MLQNGANPNHLTYSVQRARLHNQEKLLAKLADILSARGILIENIPEKKFDLKRANQLLRAAGLEEFDKTPTTTEIDSKLIEAAQKNFDLVKYFLSIGADVRGFPGTAPLGWASINGLPDIATALLESGANVKDHFGQDAMHLAAYNGEEELVKILQDYGVFFSDKDAEELSEGAKRKQSLGENIFS